MSQLYGNNPYKPNCASDRGEEPINQQLSDLLFICVANALIMPFPFEIFLFMYTYLPIYYLSVYPLSIIYLSKEGERGRYIKIFNMRQIFC